MISKSAKETLSKRTQIRNSNRKKHRHMIRSYFLPTRMYPFLPSFPLLNWPTYRQKQARYWEWLEEMEENSWEKDINREKEEWAKEKERSDEIDLIDPVDTVGNPYLDFYEIIHAFCFVQCAILLCLPYRSDAVHSCFSYCNVSLNGKLH